MLDPEKYVSYKPEGSGIEIPAFNPDEEFNTIEELEDSCKTADVVFTWWVSQKN